MAQIQHTTSPAPTLAPITRFARACGDVAHQLAAGIDAQASIARGVEVPSDHASRRRG